MKKTQIAKVVPMYSVKAASQAENSQPKMILMKGKASDGHPAMPKEKNGHVGFVFTTYPSLQLLA